tara:strand:+ start:827 stop:1048 length:222 start_codon:yes stop_codon:yes gene_type:complete
VGALKAQLLKQAHSKNFDASARDPIHKNIQAKRRSLDYNRPTSPENPGFNAIHINSETRWGTYPIYVNNTDTF